MSSRLWPSEWRRMRIMLIWNMIVDIDEFGSLVEEGQASGSLHPRLLLAEVILCLCKTRAGEVRHTRIGAMAKSDVVASDTLNTSLLAPCARRTLLVTLQMPQATVLALQLDVNDTNDETQ